MNAMTYCISLLFFVELSWGASPSVSYIFPPQYSYNFDSSSLQIKLSEAVLAGDSIQQKFGFSLWVKMFQVLTPGKIFRILQPDAKESDNEDFVSLSYSRLSHQFTLAWLNYGNELFSILNLPYTISANWIFIGISAGFENSLAFFIAII
ncbi:unnamed protein product [Blepharisma stoltei]|uniref:Uncharacterized protein n=1 Tax=Blepharisma stoltei TaxID=1481888 RepID=A0AAU9JQQ0_9CILI|nr:unnamed protein product [Blepharisma stoltei]